MSYFRNTDQFFDISMGLVPGMSKVNKFGANSSVQTSASDIWSRGDLQQVWLAPTAARTHQIVSTSTSDTSAGSGARTIRIYGLTGWTGNEVYEDVTLNGTTNVATSNSYVIIHRMKVLSVGTTINVGRITATADTDSSVTAEINAGDGQTEMAIYGVPSTKDAYLKRWNSGVGRSTAAAGIEYQLRVCPFPDTNPAVFIRKNDIGTYSTGSTEVDNQFDLLPKYEGPCIIKVEGYASSNGKEGNSAFDLILVDK